MPIHRRDFLRMAGAGAAATLLTEARAAPGTGGLAGRRPNIVLVLTDDQGYGDLGRNGNPVIRTPHLDAMYDGAVRLENHQVSPTCAPTRCALMTGKHEFRSGVTHTIFERERMSLRATTVAQRLKAAGYATGIFGKWHLGDEDAYQPGRRGFDEVFVHGAGGIGQTYVGTCGDAPGNTYFDPCVLHNGVFEKTAGYCTDVFFGQALEWMEQRKSGEPFFCYISTNAPHVPLQVPPEYQAMYPDLTEEQARFFGMVSNIDDNVGRLLGTLREWGIERDTLVVFMNDNGGTVGCEVWNAGMKGAKCTAHLGGTRAMSLWRWPGTLKPGAVNALTAHLDFLPTFCELAGARPPSGIDGFSLLPVLQEPAARWHARRTLFTHVGRWEPGAPPQKLGACSVRRGRFLYFPAERTLYDVEADPGETTDLAARHAATASQLARAYDSWWEQVLPCLENEGAHATAPKVNPFKERYWKQYGGPGPNQVAPPPAARRP